jgi:hypothetical protein
MRTRNWRWAVIAFITLSPAVAFGWGDGGHEIVAAIAFGRLNPKAKAEANRLLAIPVTPPGRAEPADPAKRFMHASHWADDVKRTLAQTADEHFIDQPFSPDHTPLPSDLPKPVNVVEALGKDVQTLRTGTDDVEKAKALRFIIHYVGDIHQPLHATTRVTAPMPEGDQGGNLFFVKLPDGHGHTHRVKLHGYWDGGLETFPRQGRNFSPPPDDQIPPAEAAVLTGNPDTDAKIGAGGAFNFQGWANESKQLGIDVAYDKLKPDRAPTQSYQKKGKAVARRRVAWAGYRLATLLNAIWKENPP